MPHVKPMKVELCNVRVLNISVFSAYYMRSMFKIDTLFSFTTLSIYD